MKKIINLLPFFVLLFLPLLFYPGAGTSAWRTSSDMHALFEFASALLAITAGIMVLLHFLSTGRWFFLIISIGFVLIGTEEFVQAIFSFSGLWPEPIPTLKLAVSTTWVTGHFVLLTSLFIALIFRERRVVPTKRARHAVIYNIIGFICAAFVALLIFKAPFLPDFVQLGTITKKLIELSFALLFFVALLFYSKIYLKQRSRSPLLWGIVACLIFRVLVHIFVFDARAFYDAHWDAAHLLVFLSYLFPIFGIWGENIELQKSAQMQLIEYEKEMAERKRAEESLRESEEKYRNMYETMIQGVVYQDASGRIFSANRSAEDILGLTMDQMEGRTSMDPRWRAIHEDGSVFPGEEHASMVALRTSKNVSGLIMGVYHPKTDETRWISIDAVPKFLPGETKPYQVYSMFTDITDRKRAESQREAALEALRESEAQLSNALQMTHAGHWEYDVGQDMFTFNDNFYRIFRTTAAAVGGYQMSSEDYARRFCYPDDVAVVGNETREAIESVDPDYSRQIEHRILFADGEVGTMTVRFFIVKDAQGRTVKTYGVNQDITERKRAEEDISQKAKELREKNEELNRFVYAVSHDLRSPLVTIQTFRGHLEQDLLSRNAALVAKDLGYIRNAADKMGRLLDEIHRISRVGRVMNLSEEASLQAIVKEALDLVAGRITARGVRVDLTEEPVVLYGDRTRLVEIFQNLVDNAAKFMGDQPAPRVEIGVEQAGEEMVFYVRDNGIGIGPEVQPLIFGLFHKLDPGSEGEGIGLALAQRIVELHGGRIWVESEGLGKGTTFRFTLAKTRREVGRIS
jgi:PAS domain S-box-containing protein